MDQPSHGEGLPPSQHPGGGAPAAAKQLEIKARLRTGEWLALAAAILIAHAFYWRLVRYPSAFDAQNYVDIAADIGRDGLFSKYEFSELRTYAYPLLLNVLGRVAKVFGLPLGLIAFEVQLALYLLAAAFFRRRVARVWPSFAPWAFVAIVLNVFALSYAPETITESISLTLILSGAGCWLGLFAARDAAWQAVLLGSLAMGSAVMVRPANLFALSAWVCAVSAIWVARRPPLGAWLSSALALVVGCTLPLVPQYVNNVRNYGRHTPLVAADLAHDQQVWGIGNLKYATVLPLVPTGQPLASSHPRVFYENPFTVDTTIDSKEPLSWYLANPGPGALTLGLHVFNMLDQDLLFTYSRDLDPWYRIPLGILNHALLALALLGAGMLAVRARQEPALVPVAVALAVYTLAHVALHATTLVEMRFGLPLLLLAGPLAAGAVQRLAARSSRRPRVLAGAFVVLWIAGALTLSHWVRQQAPSIRAWEKAPGEASGRKQGAAVQKRVAPARPDLKQGRPRGPQPEKVRPKR